MKKTSTYIAGVIFTVLLIFSCIFAMGAGVVRFRMLDTDAVQELVTKKELSEKVHAALETEFRTAENTTGIPFSVYEGSISADQLEPLIRESITNGFAYLRGDAAILGIQPDFSELNDRIGNFFSEYADKNNVIRDSAYDEAVRAAKESASLRIRTACDVFRFSMLADAGVLEPAKTYIPWAGYGVFAAFAAVTLFALLLFFANYQEPETGLYWIGSGVLIASLLVMIPSVWLQKTGWFDRFAVKTDHTFAAVTGYLYSGTHALIVTAVCGILFAVLCYLLFWLLHSLRLRKTALKKAKH
ncbi:MAG: hypothetical protein IJL32_00530 [Oscillospiraceae bacterium]|nr:hypothetical protein [Oscillospiraceae bacterium]